MGTFEKSKKALGEAGVYLISTGLSVLLLIWIMRLWEADLRVPFTYGWDGLFTAVGVKGIVDNGWILTNRYLGMPFGMNLYEFPTGENFHYLLIKLLSLFTGNYALVLNLFFLLTFPLTAVVAVFVFRHFKVSAASSVFGSLVYSFLPYHLWRGENHLFLSAYYIIPLVIMITIWLYSDKPLFYTAPGPGVKPRLNLRSRKFLACLVICVVTASSGIYYAFFACFLLLVAGISASLKGRNIYHLFSSLILITVIAYTGFFNVLPTLLYKHSQGDDLRVVSRVPRESEIYGLKAVQLLLPLTDHRIPKMAKLKEKYNESAPYVTLSKKEKIINENDSATLGIIGGIGFIYLLGRLMYRDRGTPSDKMLNILSEQNIAAVLLGTVGGLGALTAYLVFPQIRSYNRISVYIAFYSIFALVLLLDSLRNRYVGKGPGRVIALGAMALLLPLGILDQTNSGFVPAYAEIKKNYYHDAEFIGSIENSLPPEAMVFQLPFVPFPEGGAKHKMKDYEFFKGYLHSKNLRWSSGAFRFQEGDEWQQAVMEKPVEEMLETLALAGFRGIYLDRYGYEDMGRRVEERLSPALKADPVESGNGRLVFYDMARFTESFRKKYTVEEWKDRRDIAMHSLRLNWLDAFSDEEEDSQGNKWRRCLEEGRLVIHNSLQKSRRAEIRMIVSTGHDKKAALRMEGLINEQMEIGADGKSFTKVVDIPPGKHQLLFFTDGQVLETEEGPQAFRITNFRITEK